MCRYFVLPGLLILLMAGTSFGQLVGWWKLDETSGTTAADSSASGRDGTLVGALDTWVSVGGEISGLGGALEFNGNVADYVDIGSASGELNPGDGPFTLVGWLKADGGGGDRFNTVFGFGDCCAAGNGRDAIEFGAEHKSPNRTIFSIDARNSGNPPAETAQMEGFVNGPILGRWVQLAYVREDDGTTSAYVHSPAAGGLELSATNSTVTGLLAPEGDGSDNSNMNQINLGRTPFEGGDRAASGLIADVQFYHQALSAQDITQLFNNPGTSLGGGGTVHPTASIFEWKTTDLGSWSDNTHWSANTPNRADGSLPNKAGHTAVFGNQITGPTAVVTHDAVTVKPYRV